MKKLILIAVLAAAAMTSCMSEDAKTGEETTGKLITMRAVVDKPGSRAAAMTFDRFTSFHVLASKEGSGTLDYLNTAVYTLDGSEWTYAPKAYYPADGKKLSFYAYSPIGDVNISTPMDPDSGDATFVYGVPNDQAGYDPNEISLAEDLLISSVLNKDAGDVKYTFNHALASATFAAKNENKTDSELVYVITKIEITELCTTGTFTYDGTTNATGEWTGQGGEKDYVAPLPASGVALEPVGSSGSASALLTTNDFLIIMPQVPTWGNVSDTSTGTFVKITFNLRDGSGKYLYENAVRYLAIPAATDLHTKGFEMGNRYDFTFTFDASKAIKMDVEAVTGWDGVTTGL